LNKTTLPTTAAGVGDNMYDYAAFNILADIWAQHDEQHRTIIQPIVGIDMDSSTNTGTKRW